MMILDIIQTCSDYGLVNIFVIVKKFFLILQILVPIIAILFLAINVIKSVINPDDKKNFSRYKNWLIALVVVFMLPTIVNTVMGILGEDYSISSCWNNAEALYNSGESNYVDNDGENKKPVVTDPGKYN